MKGEEIPLISRVISVAETYERIVSRTENSAKEKKQALEVIAKGAGKRFDPNIAALFIQVMEKEPEPGK